MIDSIFFWGALAVAVAVHCLIEYRRPAAQYRRALRKAIRVCNRAFADIRASIPRYSTGAER